jgi:hypothetical protein
MRPSLSFCRAVLENFTNSGTVQRYGGESERWGWVARHHTKFWQARAAGGGAPRSGRRMWGRSRFVCWLRVLKVNCSISRFLPCKFVLPSFSSRRLRAPSPNFKRRVHVVRCHCRPSTPYRGPKPDGNVRIRTPVCTLPDVAAALSVPRSGMNERVKPFVETPPRLENLRLSD